MRLTPMTSMHPVSLRIARYVFACLLTLAACVARAADIEAVVLTTSWSPSGVGGSVVMDYRPAVLFRNGSYTTDAERALGAPRVDGRWQRSGSGYALTDAKGNIKRVEPKMRARPAAGGLTLSGNYRALGGSGQPFSGVPMVTAFKNFQFNNDGSVLMGSGGGATGGGVVTYGKKGAMARYRLDGWTITLTFADGRSERRLFYLFPDSNRSIGVGGSTLVARK